MENDSLEQRTEKTLSVSTSPRRPLPEHAGKYRVLAFGQYACIGFAVVGASAAVLNLYPRNPPQYGKALASAIVAVSLASQSQYFALEKQRLIPPVRKRRQPQNPQDG
ncbi:TPA: hypothetical protein HA251_03315 [Candidatus Woesearchaeota archaeon]|nr:hypothetical protein [Candidatus Woesearchaeota archaeon]